MVENTLKQSSRVLTAPGPVGVRTGAVFGETLFSFCSHPDPFSPRLRRATLCTPPGVPLPVGLQVGLASAVPAGQWEQMVGVSCCLPAGLCLGASAPPAPTWLAAKLCVPGSLPST